MNVELAPDRRNGTSMVTSRKSVDRGTTQRQQNATTKCTRSPTPYPEVRRSDCRRLVTSSSLETTKNALPMTCVGKWVSGMRLCHGCHRKLLELKKHALSLAISIRKENRRKEGTSLTSLVYEKLHGESNPPSEEEICNDCRFHSSQLKNIAVAMVQSIEVSARHEPEKSKIPVPLNHVTYRRQAGHNPPAAASTENKYSRIPTRVQGECYPMPGSVPCPSMSCDSNQLDKDDNRIFPTDMEWMMSRQTKTPATSQSSGSSGIPGAVAQQAQQYLEQNIMAWMQPKPQAQFTPGGLTSHSGSASSQTSGGQPSPSNQKTLQEHMTQTSPRHQGLPFAAGSAYGPPSRLGGASYMAPSIAGTSCIGIAPSSCIPHSLSFSGCSHHSLLQGTSFSSPCPSIYGAAQPSAAASFFARAAQRLNLSSKRRRRQHHHAPDTEPPPFRTNFCDVLRTSAPPVPPSLLRSVGKKENLAIGKVKVMLRIAPSPASCESSSFLNVDTRKKQVTVYDPTSSAAGCQSTSSDRRAAGISAPKMFAFDAIFSPDDTQAEVCSSALPEVIQAVVGGTDGCLFVYGHAKLGKTYTMIGSSDSVQELGIIPCAISWLFRLIHEQRQKTGARFSVRLSALEISGRNEVLTDLLSEYAAGTEGSGTSPGVYLKDDPVFGAQLINQSELRAPTPEKAAYLLDAALAARNTDGEDEGKNSHFLFTLHVYQYRVDRSGKGGVAGGRSRLHLFDLGTCEKMPPKSRDGGTGGCLSLSALGNVILALFNGQKHVPYKESKLTQVLREATNSLTCRVAMIAHVASTPHHYSEILGTIQLASRIHRMRRKKIKGPSNVTECTYDEKGNCVRPFIRMHAEDSVKTGSSDPDYTSSSEQSCDTVIYVGTGRVPLNERELTDNEGPPSSLPVVSRTGKTPAGSRPDASESKSANTSLATASNQNQGRSSPATAAALQAKTQQQKPSGKEEQTAKTAVAADCQPRQNQPASTQTPRTEPAQAPPIKTSTSQTHRKRHRQPQQKQDGVISSTHAKEHQTVLKTLAKDSRPQSDETWIDGPRFAKPKFDSKTLHRLQKEQWVDGPPVIYGFMDDHKQSMIRKWVEEHSQQMQEGGGEGAAPWVDFPPSSEREKQRESGGISCSGADHESRTECPLKKPGEKQCTCDTSSKKAKTEPTYATPQRSSTAVHDSHGSAGEKSDRDQERTEETQFDEDTHPDEDDTDSASNSADVDDMDNEENAEASGYDSDLYALHLSKDKVTLPFTTLGEYTQCSESVETIEVMEPEVPVPMVDSCIQVNEEDIIAESWLHSASNFSDASFLEQASCSDKEHPLRILSEEDLNLPSSFSGSRSVSIDLDSISVPDTCSDVYKGKGGLTWRLLYGNMFQKIKEQQQRQMKASEGLSSDKISSSDNVDRLARLREMMQPLSKRREEQKSPLTFPSIRTKPDLWPSDASCHALSEMVCDSRDSSIEDLSALELHSTHSEPADLDSEKYDFKFNVKPMNGLKLEAFYNKIHKVPPFSEYAKIKPNQAVTSVTADDENKRLLAQLDSGRMDGSFKERSNSFSHRPQLRGFHGRGIFGGDRSAGESLFQRKYSFSSLSRLDTSSGTSSPTKQKNLADISSTTKEQVKCQNQTDNDAEAKISSSLKTQRCEPKRSRTPSNDLNEATRRNEQRTRTGSLTYKNIDTSQLTVGQSPTNSAKQRGLRQKAQAKDTYSIPSEQSPTMSSGSSIRAKDSFSSSHSSSRSSSRSAMPTNGCLRQPAGKAHATSCCSSTPTKTAKPTNVACGKSCTRTSPTSNGSSTSGVTTTCCATKKQKSCAVKSKLAADHAKQKQCGRPESKKHQRTKSICRSTSSPSTCVDSGETAMTDVTDSENYYVARHASVSSSLASPYHKVPQTLVIPHAHHHHRHQRTSSGNGSDSSVNSVEPREAKDLLLKGTKTQQFSGTSSGYESMIRDSEGTPLSSSQESGTEGSVTKGERGRKGRRKSQGSSKRSLSAPARSPPSPTCPHPTLPVNQQPSPDVSLLRRGDRSLRRSDEEVCCPSFLCCRLLDFY